MADTGTASSGVEERNLISVGYKNLMSARRHSFRTVKSWEDKETKSPGGAPLELIRGYKNSISEEMFNLIDEVTNDIVKVFTEGEKKATNMEVLVFFRKMEGDYNRYGAEVTEGAKRQQYQESA